MEEVWQPIPGYEGLYDASSMGRIRSHHASRRRAEDGILRQFNLRGYRTVVLCIGSGRGTKLAHRLVAMAFLGLPPDSKATVNHKNLNKADNRPENLEWMPLGENIRHAARIIPRRRGAENHSSRLTAEQVIEMRQRYIPRQVTLKRLAEEYGVSEQTCHAIIHRRKWAHLP